MLPVLVIQSSKLLYMNIFQGRQPFIFHTSARDQANGIREYVFWNHPSIKLNRFRHCLGNKRRTNFVVLALAPCLCARCLRRAGYRSSTLCCDTYFCNAPNRLPEKNHRAGAHCVHGTNQNNADYGLEFFPGRYRSRSAAAVLW